MGRLWNVRAAYCFVALFLFISLSVRAETNYSFNYDANGNLMQDGRFYYEYNSFNQLARVRLDNASGTIIEEYVYDFDGNRILKVEPLINQKTVYYNKNYVVVENSSGTFPTVYYYDGDVLIARKDAWNHTYYYHPDQLGSTTLVTNASGVKTEETDYRPYGGILYGGLSRYLYTGKEEDASTGLYYFGARYYNPMLAQFIQPDVILANPYNPQALNRYSYTLNNPYKYVDPSGSKPVERQVGPYTVFYSQLVAYENTLKASNSKLTASQTLSSLAQFNGPLNSNLGARQEFLATSEARYGYGSEQGFVDNLHFITSASLTKQSGEQTALVYGYMMEIAQYLGGDESGFSYEDPKSNSLGREFAAQLNDKDPLSVQYKRFMKSKGFSETPMDTFNKDYPNHGNDVWASSSSSSSYTTNKNFNSGGKAAPSGGVLQWASDALINTFFPSK